MRPEFSCVERLLTFVAGGPIDTHLRMRNSGRGGCEFSACVALQHRMNDPAFRFLGTPAFCVEGESMPLPDTVPARLVALLALRGVATSRGELAGMLYPDEPETVARQRVRLQLSRARKLHGALPLKTSAHYASCIAVTDVQLLLRETEERNWAAVANQAAPRLLANWELPPALAEVLEPLQNQLTEAWLLSIRRNARDLIARDEHEQAFAQLSRAMVEEPTAEDVLQLLLQIGPAAGRRQEALAAFEAFLSEIEPFEPLPATLALQRQVRRESGGTLPDIQLVRNAAAVLGELSQPELLSEMVNAPVSAVITVLAELEHGGELTGTGQLADAGTVLEGLAAVERRYLHGLAASALRHTGKPFAEGEHWLLAGDSERAVLAWFPATTMLMSREIGKQDEALEFYERILSLPVRSPAWYAASAYYAAQQMVLQGPEPALARVEEVLLESDEPLARTFALLVKSDLDLAAGHLEEAAESMRLAELHALEAESMPLERDVKLSRVRLLALQGQTNEALAVTETMLELLSLEPPRFAQLTWLGAQAVLLCDLGDYGTALDSYYRQLDLARTLGYSREQVRVAADILATLADMGRAGEELELGLAALELGEFDVSWPLRYSLAEGLIARRRHAEAAEQLDAIIAAPAASAGTRGYALALKLRLPEPDSGIIKQAFEFATETELPRVRVAIAAALAELVPAVEATCISALVKDVDAGQVPAWLAKDWERLGSFRKAALIHG